MPTTKIILKPYLSAVALALLVVIGSPSTANAAQGQRPEGSPVKAQVAAVTDDEPMDDRSGSTTDEIEKRNKARTEGEAKVKSLREERKVKTTPQNREKTCEDRKKGIQTKMTSISTNSQRYEDRITEVFEKLPATAATAAAKEYTAALEAQKKASASVDALAFIKDAALIDCKNINVSVEIQSYKTAAAQTRTDLKDYKMAVKAVIKKLKTTEMKETETPSTTEISPTTPEGVN